MGACGSLTTALGILWRANLKLQSKLDAQHDEHVADVKELTRETIELARAATSAPPLRLYAPRQPGSGD